MKHIVITFVLAVTASNLAAGQSRTRRSASAPQSVKYHATVDENEGVFTFPLVPTQEYEWCPGGLQYAWTVKINSENQDFEFGYFMFTAMGASPCGRGNIQKLLREGQFSLFKQSDGSGAKITGVAEGRFVTYEDNFSDEFLTEKTIVSGFASQNQLTIKLSGAKTIQLLYANRPKYLTFESQILEKKKSMSVPITYTSRLPTIRTDSVVGNTVKQAATCMRNEEAGELVKQLVPNDVITYQLSGNLIYQRLSLSDMKRYYLVSYLFYEKGYLAMQDNGYSVSQPLTPKGQKLVDQYRRNTDVPQEADLPFATKTLVSINKVTCVAQKMRIAATYKVQPTQTALDVLGTDIYRVKPFDRPWNKGIEFTNRNGTWKLPQNSNLSPAIQ